MITKEGWVDSDTIIVCCCPSYSSIACQQINHLLSLNNTNQLHDVIPLEIPLSNMTQVLSPNMEWVLFSTYLRKFIYGLDSKYQYLFIDTVAMEPHLSSLKNCLRERSLSYRIASLFCEDKCPPIDYCPYIFNKQRNGHIIFEWENKLSDGR